MAGWKGEVLAIHVTPEEDGDPAPVAEVRVLEGRGLEGDRYAALAETKDDFEPKQQVTFIEQEALEALERDYGLRVTGAESRRNVLTRGAPLNHLIDRRFRVGDCEFVGRELCEPCGYLQSKTQKGVMKGLIHRGGLRAEIVKGGTMRAGDPITEA
jgi:MOSC domain-containing protein YiiM